MTIQAAKKAIVEACGIIGTKYSTDTANVMSLAIAGQESHFLSRRQLISKNGKLVAEGPAVSWWQMEKGGGIEGVLTHKSSASLAAKLCKARGITATPNAVWTAMQTDDVLGAGFARLLLLTDPFRLPAIGASDEAWKLYTRVWRPGKPHPSTWQDRYDAARREVGV